MAKETTTKKYIDQCSGLGHMMAHTRPPVTSPKYECYMRKLFKI